MPSSGHVKDPWKSLPNLSGETSVDNEETRSGDPERMYPSVGNGTVDAITGRILNVPRASVYLNGGGSIVTTTITPVVWDTIEYDTDRMYSVVGGSGRFTVRTPGLYRVTCWYAWGVNPTGQRGLLVRKTTGNLLSQPNYGTGVLGEGWSVEATKAGLNTQQGPITYEMPMNIGDYVEVFVSQFSGSTLAWVAASAVSRANGFQISMISTFGSDAK